MVYYHFNHRKIKDIRDERCVGFENVCEKTVNLKFICLKMANKI